MGLLFAYASQYVWGAGGPVRCMLATLKACGIMGAVQPSGRPGHGVLCRLLFSNGTALNDIPAHLDVHHLLPALFLWRGCGGRATHGTGIGRTRP